MISLIAAVAQNNCIGANGRLPWRISEDMARFKEITTGHIVLMGRKTWESLPEKFRPLPNRTNVVVTTSRASTDSFTSAEIFNSIDAALAAYVNENIFVIGGAQIYNQTIARADRLYITHVNQAVDGDAFFPTINSRQWLEVAREPHKDFSFVVYDRAQSCIITDKTTNRTGR